MHVLSLFVIQGMIIGIIISLSIGPIALITVKRTAEYGLHAGIAGGIAVALVDTLVALLILFGFHYSHSFFIHIPPEIHTILAGCVFMYGLSVFRKKTVAQPAEQPLEKHFSETVLLSLANPSTYVSFGIIALLLTRFISASLFDRAEVLIGFFLGALLWWILVVVVSFRYRDRIGIPQLKKSVGILIMALAIVMLLHPHPAKETHPIMNKVFHLY